MFVSTAFGKVKHIYGLILILKVKLSLQAWLTAIAASRSFIDHFISLFNEIRPNALYSKCECSVMAVFKPINFATWRTWAATMLVLKCPWHKSIYSRINICFINGKTFG